MQRHGAFCRKYNHCTVIFQYHSALSITGMKDTLSWGFKFLEQEHQHQIDTNTPVSDRESESSLPSLHFSEVKSDLSVGHSLLIQVTAISPYER